MSDPYQVLNISPTASDDEVKHAYRELARKYHPDNYHDNPLADLAQEKMKEVNEAYEQIQKQRRGGASTHASQRGESYGYRDSSYGATSGDPLMERVRMAIHRGDITQAEQILNSAPNHNAEWNFLMGIVCSRRGWMDEAKSHLESACRMDPTNEEYRSALNMFADGGYHPEDYRGFRTINYQNDTCMRLCTACSCCILSRGSCLFC